VEPELQFDPLSGRDLIYFPGPGDTRPSIFKGYFGEFHREPSIRRCVISGFPSRVQWNPMEPAMEEEGTMWIAFFSIASAAAVCLSVASVMLQASQGDILSS